MDFSLAEITAINAVVPPGVNPPQVNESTNMI
jgi:hypothetical protein